MFKLCFMLFILASLSYAAKDNSTISESHQPSSSQEKVIYDAEPVMKSRKAIREPGSSYLHSHVMPYTNLHYGHYGHYPHHSPFIHHYPHHYPHQYPFHHSSPYYHHLSPYHHYQSLYNLPSYPHLQYHYPHSMQYMKNPHSYYSGHMHHGYPTFANIYGYSFASLPLSLPFFPIDYYHHFSHFNHFNHLNHYNHMPNNCRCSCEPHRIKPHGSKYSPSKKHESLVDPYNEIVKPSSYPKHSYSPMHSVMEDRYRRLLLGQFNDQFYSPTYSQEPTNNENLNLELQKKQKKNTKKNKFDQNKNIGKFEVHKNFEQSKLGKNTKKDKIQETNTNENLHENEEKLNMDQF